MKDSAGLAFNGQGGEGYSRSSYKCANQYTGKSNDGALINKGRGPTKGNQSDSGIERGIGPSVTGDPQKKTIATAGQGGRINGGTTVKGFANPDKINVGR